jgi:serine/threonine-protein kinase
MAPEQAKGHQPDERFDIYALGVMFFELLTGDPPVHGTNVFEIVTRKTSEPAASVASKRGDMPEALVELVDDCLSVDPKQRPQTAQLFLARLEDVLRNLPRETGPSQIAFEASLTRGLKPKLDAGGGGDPPGTVAVAETAGAGRALEASKPDAAKPVPAKPPVSLDSGPDSRNMDGSREAEPTTPPIYYVLLVGVVLVIFLGVWVAFFMDRGVSNGIEPARDTLAAAEGDIGPDEGETVGPAETTAAANTAAPATTGDAPDSTTTETGDIGSETGDTGAATETGDTGDDSKAPTIAKHDTAECKQLRADAEAAARDFKWAKVLSATGQRKCWSRAQRNDRVQLEVEALMESERWEACVKAGQNHPSGKVKGWVNVCKGHL